MKTKWKKVKLERFFTVKKGQAITKRESNPGPYPVILGGREPAYYIDRYNHEGKAIVVSRSGASAGYVSFWNEPIFITDGFLIEPKDDVCYEFVYYLMKNNEIRFIGSQKGAAIPHVIPALLYDVDAFLPPLETQQKIARILSAYDDLIENNRKQIKLLEEAAQKLYKEWFVKLNFPGHENVKIIDNVPEEWIYKKLDKVFNYVRGRSYSSEELSETKGTLFVNLKNIQAFGGYKRDAEKRYLGVYKSEQILSSGDVVLGITDMTKERRLVGSVAQIPELGETATFTMDLIKLEPYEITKNFLYSSLRFGGISRQIAPLANGVNVLHLKPEALNQVEMLIPDSKLIQLYDEFYEPVRLKIERVQKEIQLLQSARDKLLPRLMNGDINA